MRQTLQKGLLDKYGRSLSVSPLKQKAFGQYNSIYEYPNYGRYRWRTYVNQDTELGASMLTRDLLLRWSRECTSQLPWLYAGMKAMTQFTVGNEYKVQYNGANKDWWDQEAYPFLTDSYLPNCCVRGEVFDFNSSMFLACKTLLQDGDFGLLFNTEGQFQIIPSHRIGSRINLRISANDKPVQAGPLPNTIISDGVIYDRNHKPLGYSVINPDNMVNSLLGNQDTIYFSARDMSLIFDPDYFDRGRGFPATSPGILQAMALQEMESYMIEGIKVQQMVAVVERSPSGEGPDEEATTYEQLMSSVGTALNEPNNAPSAGMKVVDGPQWKYVTVNGGDIKPLAVDAVAVESANYITKLETQVLQAMGIPHSILLSPEKMSGRMSDGIVKIFNASVAHRQKILDKMGKKIIAQALAKAMDRGDISANWDENLFEVVNFSHPKAFTLNDSYDRQDDLDYYKSGLRSMNDITLKANGKSAIQTMTEIGQEIKSRYKVASQIAQDITKETGEEMDTETIANEIKGNFEKSVTPPPQPEQSEEPEEKKEEK